MPLSEDILNGDFLSISRAITQVENGSAEAREVLDAVSSRVGGALRIGLTGPPGVGKSTTVDELAAVYLARGEKVAIIAVDPTSPFTGGALLGDRIRMSKMAEGNRIFMRSMATRGSSGGLARATQDAVDLLDASGRTVILIETVGVGQSEIEISRAADCVLVMLSPESGDGIQAMKSGLLEIADLIAINKADRGGAERMEQDLKTAFELGLRSRRDIPILITEAIRSKGIPELVAAIDALLLSRRASGAFQERRRNNMENRIKQIAEFLIHKNLWASNGAGGKVAAAADQVLARRQSPYQGAQELVREVLR
ncbi:MAG TPA: methylmalonyl Co-A mutase-associated GTPase MeaB [Planctomycetota bacterium]|nr:methylmalonyl Co-A mutase-associated GTPase MeaB [Planctomycetota bacterium]